MSPLMWLLTAAVTAGALWLVNKFFLAPMSTPLNRFPGPPRSSVLLGNLPEVIREGPGVPQLRWAREHGGAVHYTGPLGSERLLVADPALLKHVLLTNAKNYPKPKNMMRMLKRVVGNGLLTSEGAQHKRARTALTPHFQYSNLKALLPIFLAQSIKLADTWELKYAGQRKEIEVVSEAAHFTLDVIGLSAFGFEFNALESNGKSPVSTAVSALLQPLSLMLIARNMVPLIEKLPLPSLKRERTHIATVHNVVENIVRERMAQRAAVAKARADGVSVGGGGPSGAGASASASPTTGAGADAEHATLLDLMLDGVSSGSDGGDSGSGSGAAAAASTSATEAAAQMDAAELADHVVTFLVAGHETTSNALAWTFYLLDKHRAQGIEDIARDEVRRICPDVSKMTWENVADMKYLWAVVMESLRLYPPAAMTNRVAQEDDTVEWQGNTLQIPKGTFVFISPYVMGRLEQYWEEPDVFKPMRWLKSDGSGGLAKVSPRPYTFLPFLVGERMCIGHQFAQRELMVAMAVLLSRFSLELAPGAHVEPKLKVTMRPHPGLPMFVNRAEPGVIVGGGGGGGEDNDSDGDA